MEQSAICSAGQLPINEHIPVATEDLFLNGDEHHRMSSEADLNMFSMFGRTGAPTSGLANFCLGVMLKHCHCACRVNSVGR